MFSTLPASGGGGGGGGDEWQQFADDQGYPYWYNPGTEVSTYDDPYDGGPRAAAAPEPLSPSWVVVPSKPPAVPP